MIQAAQGLTSYLSHLTLSSVLGLQEGWDGVQNQAGGSVLPHRLNQTTFTFNHHLSHSCRGEAGLAFTPTRLPEKPVFDCWIWFLFNPPQTETQRLSATEPGSLLILAEISFWPLGHQIKARRGVIFVGLVNNREWKTLEWVKLEWPSTCSVHRKCWTSPGDISLHVPHSLAPPVYLELNSSPG